jgi:hypothetical protein
MESFVRQVQGLMHARVRAADDRQLPMEAAVMLIAGLPGTGGMDRERQSTTDTWITVDTSGKEGRCKRTRAFPSTTGARLKGLAGRWSKEAR